ncbi:hypothetical protein LSCM1_07601 [Leishmania martiniquensis]|uniref:Transmembrane protein n=1 Tax=Leishmania martiniquensis TaxID=1580590 RepID=A0A836HZ53_9TRYP|nr:hypothetical protein LSCM1_07601 [Leishmania martiniquensis]
MSRWKLHTRSGPETLPTEPAEHQSQPMSSTAENAPGLDPRSTTDTAQQPSPVHSSDDDGSSVGVLADAEDSYRLVVEHDEHLGRVRAYTDFYDQLACMKRTEAGEATRDGDALPRQNFDMPPISTSPSFSEVRTTAHAPDTPSQQRQSAALGTCPSPTSLDGMLADLGSESCLTAPLASTARSDPQPHYAGDPGASVTFSPKMADAKEVSWLQAENARMTVELQARQEAVQQLQQLLLEAREALLRRVSIEGGEGDAAGAVAWDRQQHPFSAAPSGGEAAAVLEDASSLSALHPPPSTGLPLGPKHFLCSFDVGHPSTHSRSAAFDVAEFFWALRVAPPPLLSPLHDGCGHSEDGGVLATFLRSPLEMADERPQTGGVYGATGRAVGKLTLASAEQLPSHKVSRYHPHDGWHHHQQRSHAETEEAVLARESAWVNSSYYCYNMMDEISSLRVVPSPDEDAGRISPAVRAVSGNPLTRPPLSHVSAAALSPSVPAPECSISLSSPTPHSSPAATSPWPVFEGAPGLLWSPSSPESAAMSAGSLSSPTARCYRLQYLRRLWVTSVLRHLLLFLLVALACALLFIPDVVLVTVNVFDAAERENLPALRNRLGYSSLLVLARLDACALASLLLCGVVLWISGWQQEQQTATSAIAQQEDVEKAAAVAVPAAKSAAPTTATTTKKLWHRIFSVNSVGALVHLILCAGTGLMFCGCILLREGGRNASLSLALLGETFYGAGEALLLGGLGTIVSAEVGVAAGVSVSLQILLMAWLIVNAFSSFVLPKLNLYVYIAAGMVDALVYVAGFIGALVFSVLMLCPRDLVDRAARAHAEDITPRKLWSAARYDVSLGFFLRALTVALLTAAVVLLMSCGFAVFIPTQAAVMAVTASAKSRELMGNSTGTGTGTTGSLAIYQDHWITQQRRAPVLLFTYALLAMPMCFTPRLASLISRWCPVPLLTTLLCIVWVVSTGASWAPVLDLDASPSTSGASSGVSSGSKNGGAFTVLSAVLSWCGRTSIRLATRHAPTPSTDVCGAATGVVYTVVVSSLLRSMANAGVALPVMHLNRRRMVVHEWDCKAAAAVAAAAAMRLPSEATPLLVVGARKGKRGNADTAAAEAEPTDMAAALDTASTRAPMPMASLALEGWKTPSEDLQRCPRTQLRGGPAVMTVLACMLIMVVLLVCVTVMTIAAVLLTSRDESPVYANPLLPGVTLDAHLILKSTLTCVLIAAMLVQWVEVSHRILPLRRLIALHVCAK